MTFILFHEWFIIHVRFWAWMSIFIWNDKKIYCAKFRRIVTPVTSYSNEKTQSYILTSGSNCLRTPRPLEINMETDVLFSYCHERPSDFNHGMQSCGRSFWVGNIYIYIDMYYRRNLLFDQRTLLNWSHLGIFRNKILNRKFVYGRDGEHMS